MRRSGRRPKQTKVRSSVFSRDSEIVFPEPPAIEKAIPCWRVHASDDLDMVADLFGADLRGVTMPASGGSVPSSWFDYNTCVEVLREHGINPNRIDTLEVYAGCANWTEACRSVGLKVGAPIDNKHQRNRWNLLSA